MPQHLPVAEHTPQHRALFLYKLPCAELAAAAVAVDLVAFYCQAAALAVAAVRTFRRFSLYQH